jgi:dUTP pyrophosphatase
MTVLTINEGNDKDFVIEPLSRIAQIVFAPVAQANLELVNELNSTARGVGGFGSTG